MPTQSESPVAVSGTPSKTVALLRKRLRQLLRVVVVLAACVAVAALVLAIWWLNSLNGLPDIGDPFDVAAFRTFRLPDDRNAFTFFRRAWKSIEPIYGGGWSETNPEFRAFVEANRPAVELFIKGAEQVDGISGPVGEPLSGENNSDLDSAYPLVLGADRDDAYGGRAARREGRHDRRLGLLSRRPPHDGPRPAAREAEGSRARHSLAPCTAETSRDLGGG
jgi:hypothetical protein